jgi:hypothetical protein
MIDSGSRAGRESVPVEHLLAHDDEDYGEGETGKTQAKAGSDIDYGEIGAVPHRAVGVGSGGSEIHGPGIGNECAEGVVRLFEIALEVIPDEYDGSVRDNGEQSSLFPPKKQVSTTIEDMEENTDENQHGIQFLMAFGDKVGVVLSGYVLEHLIESSADVVDRSRGVLRERCFGRSLL